MGRLSIMGRSGDVKVEWNPDNPDEVEVAREVFKENIKKGFKAFHFTRRDDKGEEVKEFDPGAERILFVPPMAGG